MKKEIIISQLSKGNITLIFLGIYISSMILGNVLLIPQFLVESNGIPLLDTTFNYSSNTAYVLFENLNETGRLFYLKFLLIYDFIHPLIVCIFFSSLFLFLLKKSGKSNNKILIFTFVALFVDLIENAFLSFSIINYPNNSDSAIMIANIFTMTKTISVIIYPIITITLFIFVLFTLIKKRKII